MALCVCCTEYIYSFLLNQVVSMHRGYFASVPSKNISNMGRVHQFPYPVKKYDSLYSMLIVKCIVESL